MDRIQPIMNRIDTMLKHKRLHHAFLFTGAGEGTLKDKRAIAHWMAARVFAKDSSQDQPDIERRIEKKYHPDVYTIETADKEIKLEDVQEMIGWIYRAPAESAQKFAIIEHAQRMNRSASNALLKTLEEPPAHATLILCSPSKDMLLQTLRSRMFVMMFAQDLSEDLSEDVPAWLESIQAWVNNPKQGAKDLFDITTSMSKNRGELKLLFQWLQAHLVERAKHATDDFEQNLLDDLFMQSLDLEQKIYHRYGNISLGLDRFFLEWSHRVR